MTTNQSVSTDLTRQIRDALTEQPGLSVKDLAERLGLNRQFMSGFLTSLDEQGEVSHRQVGPARIYFVRKQQ